MEFNWVAVRKQHKKQLSNSVKVIKSKKSDAVTLNAANTKAMLTERKYRAIEAAFNKIVSRSGKRSRLVSFKTPVHSLSGKYTPTALALLDFLHGSQIKLDRWILAQVETTTHSFVNLYMCYGSNAYDRYVHWENKQEKKFVRTVDKEDQTNSEWEDIASSIHRGHVAAMSWIPQLEKIQPPGLAAALFFLLPNIQGRYCLAYKEFRQEVMDTGLCDAPHMVGWYKEYAKSPALRNVYTKALLHAIEIHGPLSW